MAASEESAAIAAEAIVAEVAEEGKEDAPCSKKELAAELATAYDPVAVEAGWGEWWESAGFFKPDVEAAAAAAPEDKFIMVIPPPNVTGSLHLGHALMSSVEDALARWHRMSGRHVLWLPGTDHAGIATQAVVEKRLMRERGVTRHDLGREEFVSEVWKWKEAYGSRITMQLRRLGASVDWSREAFTMDDNLTVAVKEAFVRLHDEGLIYRETRLVNWCSALNTALSDIEVDYDDLAGRSMRNVPGHDPKRRYEFGMLTSFAYHVEDSDEEIVVATTRLETMLGDTAVAVHPEDPRYAHLHGKFVKHPFNGRRIPIICDAELVDMEFGTGAVKITPAHDPNDFACGKRHGLEMINILNDDGTINGNGGKFEGMMRFDARFHVEKALEELGDFKGKEPNVMSIPLCSRSGDVIEPRLKPQWWVNCSDMAAQSVKAVREGDLKLEPDFHKATWYRWLENIRPWCISRQLWWGHRIPAYYARVEGEERKEEESGDRWFVGRSEDEARARAAEALGVDADKVVLEQDPDVLDTWFSSALFPFSTMGWPREDSPDLDAFYPNTLLETGHDILFFWVARMVMMGIKLTGRLPFSEVYLHAMVRDKYGRKMSKSLGNVIDPLEVIEGITLEALIEKLATGNLKEKERKKATKGMKADFPKGIPQCGADALRFGLLAYTLQGRDINLDVGRVAAYRNFCNKLWQTIRFTDAHFADGYAPPPAETIADNEHLAPRDHWILSRLTAAISEAVAAFEGYAFATATSAFYNFWLHDLCDVYLELSKNTMYEGTPEAKAASVAVLYHCLEMGLRLAHPMMPFVTEELWQHLPRQEGDADSIMLAAYPAPVAAWRNEELEARMTTVMDVIRALRSLRASYGLTRKQKSKSIVWTDDAALVDILSAQLDDIVSLSTAASVDILLNEAMPDGVGINTIHKSLHVGIHLAGMVDPATEITKLEKKINKLDKQFAGLLKKMGKPSYAKAPEAVRVSDAERKVNLEEQRATLEDQMEKFRALMAAEAGGEAAAEEE